MIEVRLFGKLRRFAGHTGVAEDAIVELPSRHDEVVGGLLERAGISLDEVGNVFVNGRVSELGRKVVEGDRVGVFPRDMSLLYI